jgi:hypothetical protein
MGKTTRKKVQKEGQNGKRNTQRGEEYLKGEGTMGKTKEGWMYCIDSIRKPNTLNILHPPSPLSPLPNQINLHLLPFQFGAHYSWEYNTCAGFLSIFFSLYIPGIISGAKKGYISIRCVKVSFVFQLRNFSAHNSSSVDLRI